MQNNSAILLAAGGGSRMRGSVKDKTLAPLLGKPVLYHSAKAFLDSGAVGELVFVCRDDAQISQIKDALSDILKQIPHKFTYGGAERQDSVLNGLLQTSPNSKNVFIHDSARPLVGAQNIKNLADALKEDECAVLAAKVVDTIKKLDSDPQNLRRRELLDLERPLLWAMQTPQAFRREIILDCYKKVAAAGAKITDDVAAASKHGHKITIVENIYPNPKITVPEDLAIVEFLKSKGAI
ncbi:MAG: 2-C-methyl-D-erythritol 4-phosphate cytidylyltransferase [Opitutales bacterium]|nr:2-C-methyl-D-erythritol 4-phosphate cytidylyltransferase [Opitutales bacterium]